MKTLLKGIEISHIASSLPSKVLKFDDLKDLFGDKEVDKVMKTTGINSVHIAADDTTSSDLCFYAAKKILDSLDTTDDIDGLIFVSQTRDHVLPQSSHILQAKLGLSQDTYCLDMPLGCSGYIYGLMQASLLISTGACNKVLVLAGDTTSKLVNEQDRASRLVFGDAGSATLLQKGNDGMYFDLRADGSGKDSLIVPSGGFRNPSNSKTSITKPAEEGCSRSQDDLFMDGMSVFNFAITKVPKLLKETLLELNWTFESLDAMVLHQANKFMVDYLRRKMKLPLEMVPIEVKNYGNTGPASIPLAITSKYSIDKPKLNNVLLAGFGVGLSWGACNCNLQNTIIFEPEIFNKL